MRLTGRVDRSYPAHPAADEAAGPYAELLHNIRLVKDATNTALSNMMASPSSSSSLTGGTSDKQTNGEEADDDDECEGEGEGDDEGDEGDEGDEETAEQAEDDEEAPTNKAQQLRTQSPTTADHVGQKKARIC